MKLDEYRAVWRSETSDADAPEEERLLERVREASEAFDRKIRRRDLLETLAAVIVAAVFGYEAATVARPMVVGVQPVLAQVIPGGGNTCWARDDRDPCGAISLRYILR